MAEDVVSTTRAAILLELRQFRAELATMGPGAKQAAADMTRGIQQQLKAAEAAARASAKNINKDTAVEFGRLEKATTASLGKIGGVFGELGDVVFDIVGPIAEVSGSLGGVAGAVAGVGTAGVAAAAGVALYVAGVREIVQAAGEARDRLEDQGLAAKIPPEAKRSLDQYNEAATELNEALDILTVTVGGELADDLAVLTTRTVAFV